MSLSKGWVRALWILAAIVVAAIACLVVFAVLVYETAPARYQPVLELYESNLQTPSGPIPFRMENEWREVQNVGSRTLRVEARAPELGVLIKFLPKRHQVFIRGMPAPVLIEVAKGRSSYRRNDEPARPLNLTKAGDPGALSIHAERLDFELPEPLARLDVTMYGGTLTPERAEVIRLSQEDVHHLRFAFSVDGKPFVADLKFSLKLYTYKAILGAPGVP